MHAGKVRYENVWLLKHSLCKQWHSYRSRIDLKNVHESIECQAIFLIQYDKMKYMNIRLQIENN